MAYMSQPSTSAKPTKAAKTLAPYPSRSRGVFLLKTPKTTETRNENTNIAIKCEIAILEPSDKVTSAM